MYNIISRLKNKGIKADLFSEKIESKQIEFENNKFKGILDKSIKGYGLRLIHNNREGFSYSNKLDEEIIDRAVDISKFGETVYYEFPYCNINSENIFFDSKIEKIDSRHFIDFAKEVISDLTKSFKDFYFSIKYNFISKDVSLINTSGFDVSYSKTIFSLSVSGSSVNDGMIEVYEYTSSSFLDNLECIFDRLKEKIVFSLKKASITSGEYGLIMTPKALESFVDILLTGFNGKLIEKGVSPLIELTGKKKGVDFLTIIDNGTDKFLTGSFPFDGDGIVSNDKYLIENGVFGEGIFDLKTASRLNKKPTGNSIRTYNSIPSIGFRNIIFVNGNKSINSIIKGIKKGVLVDQLLGAGMSNVLAGEFSANVDLGFLIENGEIVGRIKDTMITANVFDAISRILEVSKETYNFGSFVGPYVLFDKFKVIS